MDKPDETEVKKLQAQILNLEGELSAAKKKAGDSDSALKKVNEMSLELEALKKERDEFKSKIWDGKNRRNIKERRVILGTRKNDLPDPKKEEDNPYGGPFS